jgi:hypothetical protein
MGRKADAPKLVGLAASPGGLALDLRPEFRPGRQMTAKPAHGRVLQSLPRWHPHLGADVDRHVGGVIIDEVAHSVVRDAPESGPFPQGPDGRRALDGEDPALLECDDVDQL